MIILMLILIQLKPKMLIAILDAANQFQCVDHLFEAEMLETLIIQATLKKISIIKFYTEYINYEYSNAFLYSFCSPTLLLNINNLLRPTQNIICKQFNVFLQYTYGFKHNATVSHICEHI